MYHFFIHTYKLIIKIPNCHCNIIHHLLLFRKQLCRTELIVAILSTVTATAAGLRQNATQRIWSALEPYSTVALHQRLNLRSPHSYSWLIAVQRNRLFFSIIGCIGILKNNDNNHKSNGSGSKKPFPGKHSESGYPDIRIPRRFPNCVFYTAFWTMFLTLFWLVYGQSAF